MAAQIISITGRLHDKMVKERLQKELEGMPYYSRLLKLYQGLADSHVELHHRYRDLAEVAKDCNVCGELLGLDLK